MRARLLLCFALCLAACKGPYPEDFRPIQDSATGEPRVSVSLNRVISGYYRTIAPMCIGQQYVMQPAAGGLITLAGGLSMNPGQIVEFRNYQPEVPTNITSLSAPASLFSPNLVRPYNVRTEGVETYSYWRHVFPKPGAYEFFDTNMGDPGRKIVDSYYGTVSYIGESNAPRGVVCVDPPNCLASADCLTGTQPVGAICCTCMGVCCEKDIHCTSDKKTCLRGRCVDRETGQ